MKEQCYTHNSEGSFIFGLVIIFLETNHTLRVTSNHLPRTKVSKKEMELERCMICHSQELILSKTNTELMLGGSRRSLVSLRRDIQKSQRKNWIFPDQDVIIVSISSLALCMLYFVLTISRDRMLISLKQVEEMITRIEV